MARKHSHGRKRRGSATKGRVRVKGHTRTPRGANQGKRPVRVKGYRRRLPK